MLKIFLIFISFANITLCRTWKDNYYLSDYTCVTGKFNASACNVLCYKAFFTTTRDHEIRLFPNSVGSSGCDSCPIIFVDINWDPKNGVYNNNFTGVHGNTTLVSDGFLFNITTSNDMCNLTYKSLECKDAYKYLVDPARCPLQTSIASMQTYTISTIILGLFVAIF